MWVRGLGVGDRNFGFKGLQLRVRVKVLTLCILGGVPSGNLRSAPHSQNPELASAESLCNPNSYGPDVKMTPCQDGKCLGLNTCVQIVPLE